MEETSFVLAKTLAGLLGDYREVAERIVVRADHNRYVTASDRMRLASLNDRVNQVAQVLQQREEAQRSS